MATNIGSLAAKGTLDAGGFTAGLALMRKQAEQTGASIQGAFGKVGTVLGGFGRLNLGSAIGGLGFGAGITGIVSAIEEIRTKTLDAANAQAKLADRFGISTQAAAGLLNLGGRIGIDADELNRSLLAVQRRFGAITIARQIGEPIGEAGFALRALGFELDDFLRLPLDRQLGLIGDRLKQIRDPGERAALSFQILARYGQSLGPILERGTAGIQNTIDMVTRTGEAMTDIEARRLQQIRREREIFRAETESMWAGLRNRLGSFDTFERNLAGITTKLFQYPSPLFGFRLLGSSNPSGNLTLSGGEAPSRREILLRSLGVTSTLTGSQIAALNAEIEKVEAALDREQNMLGLTTHQLQLYELAQRGATSAQLDGIIARQRDTEAQQLEEEQRTRAEHLRHAARTPASTFLRDAREILTSRFISPDQQALALAPLLSRLGTLSPSPLPGGIDRGTAEAVAVINEYGREQISSADRVLSVLERQEEQGERQLNMMRDVRDVLRQFLGLNDTTE